ncbi:Lrp/AsnC family transcriptional regulator [Flavisphingomonas formosensis]|uniref:Lrp/AsnC family transcriptional regulator n=1 Tax=Flavisphingomonas formosensis TaxID=861534 RepID=UPI0012FBCEE0|nr:Lrp/AsnC family transcriptional regulator [Sphingomonas formosensis]
MKSTVELDSIDRRILEALQENALLSNAELADRVGSSAASCWRRVRALEVAGVLGPAVRLLDPAAVDRGVNVLCNVRMRSHSRESIGQFEIFVRGRPEIMECYSMSGEWDYLLRIVVADVADYEHFLMRVLLEHPSVGGAASHFALSQTKYTTKLPV